MTVWAPSDDSIDGAPRSCLTSLSCIPVLTLSTASREMAGVLPAATFATAGKFGGPLTGWLDLAPFGGWLWPQAATPSEQASTRTKPQHCCKFQSYRMCMSLNPQT